MRIVGPDELVFGVDDPAACRSFLADYGLMEAPAPDGAHFFEALDGTGFTLRRRDDPALPAPLRTGSMLRLTVWGVEDQASLDAIEAELSRDRKVDKAADGTLRCQDDAGFEIAFRITTRRKLDLPAEMINSPGAKPGRPANIIGANQDAEARPRTLSHIVYFVPDMDKMANFYIDRLKFVVTDKFNNAGPFLRPQANWDHHCLFMIQTPEYMQGLEHVAFHMQGPTDLMLAGSRMVKKGYESFWGPRPPQVRLQLVLVLQLAARHPYRVRRRHGPARRRMAGALRRHPAGDGPDVPVRERREVDPRRPASREEVR
jgi:hypothetical protein